MTIAIIPAGGHAVRMGGLPKMLLPSPSGGTLLSTLLDRIEAAAPREVVIAATNGNKKLLKSYRARAALFDAVTPTMTHAVLLARGNRHMDDKVLFGMPDTWWQNDDVFQRLSAALDDGADVAVAVWPVRENQRGQGGQVNIWPDNRIVHVVDKDPACDYSYIWGALAWKPVFWNYLDADMPHVGYGLQPAIDAGVVVTSVVMPGAYWDCGTPNGYFACIRSVDERVSE
jgi:bifunctional N-acetylglucosamine-1-phosphate-uridyltransferase/glucosamine-1-phosphate-acetyltransferase GlmU-like protein